MLTRITIAALAAVLIAAPADARPRSKTTQIRVATFDVAAVPAYPASETTRPASRAVRGASNATRTARHSPGARNAATAAPRQAAGGAECYSASPGREVCPGGAPVYAGTPGRQVVDYGDSVVVGGRPAGCPRLFCGCEASLYLFGKIIPDLNLAANWYRMFPRTQPAPGMAAARSGHVFVLISHVEGSNWLVHDGNSGGGKTRRHVRSIAGYVVVNPHSRMAALR